MFWFKISLWDIHTDSIHESHNVEGGFNDPDVQDVLTELHDKMDVGDKIMIELMEK